jgi:hypothetical protein
LDTNNTPHVDRQEPITGARACRLNQEVSSLLRTFSNYENGTLPNDVIMLRNNGEDQEVFGGRLGVGKDHTGRPSQVGGPQHPEFESVLESRSSVDKNRRLGRIRSQFRRSTYLWKAKEISFPIPPVPYHYQF